MENRIALVTGGTRGIGKAIAIHLARNGWNIAVCYHTNHTTAEQTVKEIRSISNKVMSLQCDVSNPTASTNLVNHILDTWQRIDALINCAGLYHKVPLLDETVDGWNAMFEHNLNPIFYLSKSVAETMKTHQWGRIINFGIANADQMIAQTNITAHYISKTGVLILTRSLAKVLGPYGITVNSISPGFIDSENAHSEEMNEMKPHIPAGYLGNADDIVSAVKFLLSDEARYINGTNIHVSGGWGI